MKHTVTLATKEGPVTIPALQPVAGLSVHKTYRGLDDNGAAKLGDEWMVTHTSSGLATCQGFSKRTWAVNYAKSFAANYDVTLDQKALLQVVRDRGNKPSPATLCHQAQFSDHKK